MGYQQFTNDYTGARTPAYVAAETARINARKQSVANVMQSGNAVMGGLVTECCSDPAYGGQSFFGASAPASLVPSTDAVAAGTSSSNPDVAALSAALANVPLTPVDIITGTYGFPLRRNGRPWPRPRLPGRFQRAWANGYPNVPGTADELRKLVPPCPCGPSTASMVMVPATNTPPPASVSHETVASEQVRLAAWRAGLSGLGQTDTPFSGFGGLLAIVAGAGMLWWATKK
jgi:hypothetical protein